MTRYRRPTHGVRLDVAPELASWDVAGSSGQARLTAFLSHVDVAAAPLIAQVTGPLAIELTVGLSPGVPLWSGGRDLDNYLYPVAQRLGASYPAPAHSPHRLTQRGASPQPPAQLLGGEERVVIAMFKDEGDGWSLLRSGPFYDQVLNGIAGAIPRVRLASLLATALFCCDLGTPLGHLVGQLNVDRVDEDSYVTFVDSVFAISL